MKLNLGCGNDILEGYMNHDIRKHRKEIDIAFDLNYRFGGGEMLIYANEIDEIRAWDVLEHLDNPINFMDDCWALLKPDGILDLKVCGWKNPNFWVDITHKKGYDIHSFDYFDPSTELGQLYGYYTSRRWQIQPDYPKYDRRKNVIIKLKPIKV